MVTAIRIVNLKKQFGDRWISNGINLTIPTGKMTVIIGRSGEGKSLLLKQIIGLVNPTQGHIFFNDVDITTLSLRDRNQLYKKVGYVFQFAALLDSLTVFENVGITLLESGMPYADVLPIVQEKIALVGLSQRVLDKYPVELSGGMRKRVGLARTLITNPKIILYDEPTTGLDPVTTRIIHELMHRMQQKLKITSVVVSHNVDIFNYADYVALLHQGKIRYTGNAQEVWHSDNPYLHQFIRGLSEGPLKINTPHEL